MSYFYRTIALLSFVAVFAGITGLYTPHSIDVKLNGDYTVTAPADRVALALQVSYESSRQVKAAEKVRQISEEILGLLRPLTLPPNRTTASVTNVTHKGLAPIATLSVDAFSLDSRGQYGILGEQTVYSSSVKILAEFRSLAPMRGNPGAQNLTATPGDQFHYLSLVLPSLIAQPHTKIQHLRWFLSPETLAAQESTVRKGAMNQMLAKIEDYTEPMRLSFPLARCVTFHDEKRYKPREWSRSVVDAGIQYQTDHSILYGGMDMLEEPVYGRYDIDRAVQKAEAFGMEPKSIEITVKVQADWRIVERGLAKWLLGYVF